LRWRLFVNSLRRPTRGAELGLQALWFIFGGGFVLLTCAGFFGGAIALIRIERTDLLDLLLWGVFLVWQLAPILFEGYSPGLNFREVARYPISFRVYFLLSSAYGMADPAAITCMLWLLSMWLGVVVARPAWAFTAAIALLLFAALNLLLNRIVIGLFERFQSTRRGRERMVFLMFVLLLLPQFLQFVTGYWTNFRVLKLPAWILDAVVPLREFSPPGVAAKVFLLHGGAELWALGGLLLYGCLAFLLLQRQLRTVHQGEIYAEAYTVRREMKVQQGWRVPLVDGVTAAIIEKELRYVRQTSRLLLQLIYPPIIFLLIAFNGPSRKFIAVSSPGGLLAGMAGFMLLSVPNMAYNNFGMDKEAFGRWLLSPSPLTKVLLAKNLTCGGIFLTLYLIVAGILTAISHIGLVAAATVTVGFLAILVVQLGAGNLVSVYWPKRIELAKMNSKMVSNAAGLASLLVMLPLMAIAGVVAFASWYWQLPWLPLLCGLIILAASLKVYLYLLDRSAQYAWQHIEEITGNLGA
jgi:hypothetical protein